jgi:hypothetical protein
MVPELVAVFLGRLVLEKHAAHELLGDRRVCCIQKKNASNCIGRQSQPGLQHSVESHRRCAIPVRPSRSVVRLVRHSAKPVSSIVREGRASFMRVSS